MIVFVRPGIKELLCGCYSYFGSGCGSVKLSLSQGAVSTSDPIETLRNGFLQWKTRKVFLPEGAVASVEESYYPGEDIQTTYIADIEKWRNSRREHLIKLFFLRREERERAELFQRRAKKIETKLREAIFKVFELEKAAKISGKSGGRARRRSVRLRKEVVDQKQLAAALASTWIVEVECCCNRNRSEDDKLDSRKIRWELDSRSCRKVPTGCEEVLKWL